MNLFRLAPMTPPVFHAEDDDDSKNKQRHYRRQHDQEAIEQINSQRM